jgi:hypothetical protein
MAALTDRVQSFRHSEEGAGCAVTLGLWGSRSWSPTLSSSFLDGRSAADDFIRRRFGKELHAAFKQGGYIGGEIGYCYELARLVLAEEKSVADKKGPCSCSLI